MLFKSKDSITPASPEELAAGDPGWLENETAPADEGQAEPEFDVDSIAEDVALEEEFPKLVGELEKNAPQVAPDGIAAQSQPPGNVIGSDLAPGGDYVEGGGQVVWNGGGFEKA
jgi:hypothetical protein